MTDKLQALKDIQIETEKFKGEPTSALHYKIKEKQSKAIKQSTLICLVTLQSQLPNDSYTQGCVRVDLISVEMLDLRK